MSKQSLFSRDRIAYTIEGRGSALVFMHGFCEDKSVWDDITPFFSANHTVICIDLPGFGLSRYQPVQHISGYAALISGVLAEAGVEKYIFIGHSLGGYVGLELMSRENEKFSGLVMFHSQPYRDNEEKIAARRKGIAFIRKNGKDNFVKETIKNLFYPPFFDKNQALADQLFARLKDLKDEAFIDATQAMIDREDHSATLRQAKVPVCFIIGREDKAIPHENSINQTHLPALADIHMLENVAHMGQFEAREQSISILDNFIKLSGS